MLRSGSPRAQGRVLMLCLLGAMVALGAGCSGHAHERINQREYAPYRSPGQATIDGQVVMTLSSGITFYGAACQVRLSPVTSDSMNYIQEVAMKGGHKQWKNDADAVWWLAQANDEGRFRFTEVPSGSYYLTCPVAWRDPTTGETKQRVLWAETTVAGEDTSTVSVSR